MVFHHCVANIVQMAYVDHLVVHSVNSEFLTRGQNAHSPHCADCVMGRENS